MEDKMIPIVTIAGKPEKLDYETDDTPDDDEELSVTPPSVVSMLGFDPLDYEEEFAYNPDQPRDEHGRWTSGGSDDLPSRPVGSKNKPELPPGLAAIRKAIKDRVDDNKATIEYLKSKNADGHNDEDIKAAKEALKKANQKLDDFDKNVPTEISKIKLAELEEETDKEFRSVETAKRGSQLIDKYKDLYSNKLSIDPDSEKSGIRVNQMEREYFHKANSDVKIAALEKIPLGMHEQLAKFGTGIVIGDKESYAYPPYSTRPEVGPYSHEGATAGLTKHDVPGVYCPPEKTVISGDPKGQPPEDVVLHEMGHAVDHMYGNTSQRHESEKAWHEFNNKISPEEKSYKYNYYVGQKTKESNLSESFAESFKDYHKYGYAFTTQKWGKGYSDIHSELDRNAQGSHDWQEALKDPDVASGKKASYPTHDEIQY